MFFVNSFAITLNKLTKTLFLTNPYSILNIIMENYIRTSNKLYYGELY